MLKMSLLSIVSLSLLLAAVCIHRVFASTLNILFLSRVGKREEFQAYINDKYLIYLCVFRKRFLSFVATFTHLINGIF